MGKLPVTILWIQGIYTMLTALWHIINIESFIWVSGYKIDIWLVKTVSVLLLAISVSMLVAIFSKASNYPVYILSLLTAAGLAYVDFYYALGERISKVYLSDAVIEVLFVFAWMIILIKGRAQFINNKIGGNKSTTT